MIPVCVENENQSHFHITARLPQCLMMLVNDLTCVIILTKHNGKDIGISSGILLFPSFYFQSICSGHGCKIY